MDWLDLPVDPVAAEIARSFVAIGLVDADPDIVDVAVLLTSELVANATLRR